MAFYLVPRDNASSRPGTAVACRCCPAGSRSTRDRRYPSDMTDAEWAVIEPLLPAPGWMAGLGGSPGLYCRRGIVDAPSRSKPPTPWAKTAAATTPGRK